MPRALRIFVSYAHADLAFRDDLVKHLTLLERQNVIERWDDRCIRPGDDRRNASDDRIERADLILLLVSADFLASDYCYDVEMKRALARHEARQARVVPVILRPVFWRSADFGKLLPLPADGKPVVQWETADAAWADIADAIAREAAQHKAPLAGVDPPLDPSRPARAEGRGATRPSGSGMDRYRLVRSIAVSPYGEVFKCRMPTSDEVCVVKRTLAETVSIPALEILGGLGCANIAAPRRIWSDDQYVYEELPYIGGTRLSHAVPRGIGGLRGAMLKALHQQMGSILRLISSAGLVHRDVHPDNLYIVLTETDPRNDAHREHAPYPFRSPLGISEDGPGEQFRRRYPDAVPCEVSFVLVDNTFVIRAEDGASAQPVSHGSYTPAEQALGAPTPASDLYALGATLHFAVTGDDIPPFRQRTGDPVSVHPARHGLAVTDLEFDRALSRLLVREASRRCDPGEWGDPCTQGTDDVGAIALDDGRILLCSNDDWACRRVSRTQLISRYSEAAQGRRDWLAHNSEDATSAEPHRRRHYERQARVERELTHWVERLHRG